MNKSLQEAVVEQITEQILSGNRQIVAKILTRIERNDPSILPVLKSLYLRGGKTAVVGITGPPGAGKSTLINSLIRESRRRGQSVAVLAVDPSSPYTGGSILGDRVRMNQHSTDPGVFIRSMAARGHLGGLAKAAGDAIIVLETMGFDLVIVETVGVGQSEVDIIRHASSIVLVQPPHSGDKIQSAKSGIMEIANIFVVNKADLPGVDEFVRGIREMVQVHYHGALWSPPIVETLATSGVGIEKVLDAIRDHQRFLQESPETSSDAMMEKIKFRVSEICQQMIRQQVMDQGHWSDKFKSQIDDIIGRRLDPYTLAETIVNDKM